MAQLDSSLKIVSLFFLHIVTKGFLDDPIFNFFNFLLIYFICSSSCKMAHWDTLSTRRSISNCGLLSTNDTEFRATFPELVWSSRRVALDISFSNFRPQEVSLGWKEHHQKEAAAAANANCFSVSPFGAGRGVESPSSCVRSLSWEITL